MTSKDRSNLLDTFSRGLENNPNSTYLWRIYLTLYLSYVSKSSQAKKEIFKVDFGDQMYRELVQLFDEALQFNPSSFYLWQM